MTRPRKQKSTSAVSKDMEEKIYSQLAEIACDHANEGADLDSFIPFAIQIDKDSRWHDLAIRIFGDKAIGPDGTSPIFLYGILDTDVFLRAFEGISGKIEAYVSAELEKDSVRGMIITDDCFWSIDIPLGTSIQ